MERRVRLVRNDWESEFFGREIYRLEWQDKPRLKEVQCSLRNAPRTDLLEARLPAEQLASLAVLTGAGFWVADILVDFEASASCPSMLEAGGKISIAVATEADLPSLLDTCMSLHFGGRYYRDPFRYEDGTRYYALWTEKGVHGQFDDVCFIARNDDHIASFACARRIGLDAVRIGLMGSMPQARSSAATATAAESAGSKTTEMVWQHVASWARSMGRNRLFVQTQLGNSRAIEFYSKMGGRIRSSQIHAYCSPGGSAYSLAN